MRKLRTIEMKRLSVEEYHEAEKTPGERLVKVELTNEGL